jgi:hypothetical protein
MISATLTQGNIENTMTGAVEHGYECEENVHGASPATPSFCGAFRVEEKSRPAWPATM